MDTQKTPEEILKAAMEAIIAVLRLYEAKIGRDLSGTTMDAEVMEGGVKKRWRFVVSRVPLGPNGPSGELDGGEE